MINEIEVDKTFTLFPNQELTFIDKNEIFPKFYYDTFLKMSPTILSLLLPIINDYDLIEIKNEEFSYFNFEEPEIIESAIEFYRSLPNKKYYLEIEKYLNPNNQLLQFLYGNIFSSTTGNTFYFYKPNKKSYILVRITNEIHDLLTLDHELAHAYFNKYSTLNTFNTPYYYLTEAEGLFFEYLKEELLIKKDYPQEEIYRKRIEHINDIIETIIKLYVGNIAVNQYSQTKQIDESIIMEKAYKRNISTEYDINLVYDSLREYPRSSIKECISYLTFLDLKNIAEKDLEKALYLLENIRKDPNPNIITTLRKNEITFMDDNYENFNKEFEKIKEYKI